MFVWGLVGFGLTSALCAIAPGAVPLIAARALQGVAGALLVPSSLALITAVFPGDERGAAIGSWTAWTGIAFVIGPLGGGALIEFVSWRWIFAINIPVVLATLWLVRAGVPESRDEQAPRAIDYLGALLVSLGLAGPVFALIEQPMYGWERPAGVGPDGRRARPARAVRVARAPHRPSDDAARASSARATSRSATSATLMIYGGLGAMSFFVVIFLQQVAGYSPIAAGLSLMPITLLMWTLSRRFGALSDRIGPRLLMGIGPIVAGLGILWIGRLGADVNYLTDVLPGVLVFGLGLSATVAPLTNTVLGAVPQHNAGVASGINNQIARVASLLAIAAVGAVVAATFESELGRADVDPLSGGPPEVVAASVEAYRTGMTFAGGLVVLGGVISLIGIVNPRREERELRVRHDEPGPVRIAQPCPEGRRAA